MPQYGTIFGIPFFLERPEDDFLVDIEDVVNRTHILLRGFSSAHPGKVPVRIVLMADGSLHALLYTEEEVDEVLQSFIKDHIGEDA